MTPRRTFMKWMAAAPVFATMAARGTMAKLSAATRKGATADVYRRLGVRPFINARGTWTYLSGSLELPAVRQAMEAASQHFVDIFELQRAAGKRLAELSGAESGMVTSGAAGAMAMATAACIAGKDPRLVWQLPDTTGLKHEVVMLGGRSAFDNAIRAVGGKLVLVHKLDDLAGALNANTAMVYTTWLGEPLKAALAITKKAGVPMLLDDAAGIPPIDNMMTYAKMGIDLYCFSGGKGLRGPQCSGLMLGRKDLIEAALANSSPWEGAVCRAMKVGKEEIVGLVTAVEEWTKMDLSKLDKEWSARVERIKKVVDTVPGVTSEIEIPKGGNRYPTLVVKWDEKGWNYTVADCDRDLRAGEPRIEVLTNANPSLVPAVVEGDEPKQRSRKDPPPERPNQLRIISMTMQDGEELMVAQRMRELLNGARKRAGKA
ncbi:MAG: aminotransferase class V-fold PLP-dependent enzyme [Bryobacteraceae bacterium]